MFAAQYAVFNQKQHELAEQSDQQYLCAHDVRPNWCANMDVLGSDSVIRINYDMPMSSAHRAVTRRLNIG